MKLIFCTHNKNKCVEISTLIPKNIEVISLHELKHHEEVIESGSTLEENSMIKAKKIYKLYEIPCFADDTGLEVESLNGEPGVHTARYAGTEKNDTKNMNKLLKAIGHSNNRKACFRTIITYIDSKCCIQFEGLIEGKISKFKVGSMGFGYDPIFIPKGSKKTFAQMSLNEKNQYSHRSLAVNKFVHFLNNKLS